MRTAKHFGGRFQSFQGLQESWASALVPWRIRAFSTACAKGEPGKSFVAFARGAGPPLAASSSPDIPSFQTAREDYSVPSENRKILALEGSRPSAFPERSFGRFSPTIHAGAMFSRTPFAILFTSARELGLPPRNRGIRTANVDTLFA